MAEEKSITFFHVAATYVLTRVVLTLIGILAMFYFPPSPGRDLRYHAPQPAYFETWARWDSEWYLLIADHGYESYDHYRDYGGGKYLKEDTAHVFPGYPFCVRLLSYILRNSVLCGILISNIAAILFLYYLYMLARSLFDEQAAFRSAIYCIVFPTSFFLSAVYSESLFLAAITAAFYFVERKNLIPAIIACAIASCVRVNGALALPAILWLAWIRFPEKRWAVLASLSAALMLPVVSYLIFIEETFGSFRWFLESQRYWRGGMHYPLYAFVRFFNNPIAIHGQHNSLIDFFFASFSLLALALSIRRLPGPYVLYAAIMVLFPLSSTLFSFSRLLLCNFPLFLFLGTVPRWPGQAIQFISAMLLAFFMAAFSVWYWVG
jgi:hypothetical protein